MSQVNDRPCILVADDDPEFREELLPEALGRLNARVLTAKDVLEACLVVAEHGAQSKDPLDLIVLDMHMPCNADSAQIAEEAGIQFLRACHLTDSPVVVFTAYPSYRNCVRAVQAGAVAYLPKKEHDAFKGPEGGIDGLIETCRRLLTRPQADKMHLLPDGFWMSQNYDWLLREFAGRWVAFVPASAALSAGITGMERGGLLIVSEKSAQSLARVITQRLSSLGTIPHIAFVPRAE